MKLYFSRFPTIQNLMRINGMSEAKAEIVRQLAKGKEFQPEDFGITESEYHGYCLNNSNDNQFKIPFFLEIVAKILDVYHIGYISHIGDNPWECKGLTYVNMGDTYDTTLIYNWDTLQFVVCPWGNIVESSNNYI